MFQGFDVWREEGMKDEEWIRQRLKKIKNDFKKALDLGDIPYMVVVGGARILPKTPYIDLGGVFGTDISSGNAVKNPEDIFKKARLFGENISKVANYLVIIP